MKIYFKFVILFFLLLSLILTTFFIGLENLAFNNVDWLLGGADTSNSQNAWTFFKNGNIKSRMKILESSIIYQNHKNELNKIIIKDGSLFISLKEGCLKCTEIQIESKKKMSAKSLLNGYKFSENSFVL